MRKINLLPKSFIQSRRTRHRGIVLGSLCGILTCMLVVGGFAATNQLDAIATEIARAKNEIHSRQTREADRFRFESQRDNLQRLLALRKVADVPLQPSVALAAVFELQPDSIVLSKVSVDLPPLPPPESAAPANSPAAPPRRTSEASKPLNIEIAGYALSDLDAARFVGALSNHPAFASVMLSSSKRVEVAGTPRYQFQVRAQIPSDRRYHVESDPSAEARVAEVNR